MRTLGTKNVLKIKAIVLYGFIGMETQKSTDVFFYGTRESINFPGVLYIN